MDGFIDIEALTEVLNGLKKDVATVDWANNQLNDAKVCLHDSNTFTTFASVADTDELIDTMYRGIEIIESVIDHSRIVIKKAIEDFKDNDAKTKASIDTANAEIDDLLGALYDQLDFK